MTKTDAVEATCEAAGNSAYWTCSGCGKYFSDEAGATEIAANSWVISALGHAYGAWIYDDATNHKKVCANDASHVVTEAHTYGTLTKVNDTTYERTCSVCNHVDTVNKATDGNKTTSVGGLGNIFNKGGMTPSNVVWYDANGNVVAQPTAGGTYTAVVTYPDGTVDAYVVTITASSSSSSGSASRCDCCCGDCPRGCKCDCGCPTEEFTDLSVNGWYHEYVDYVFCHGLMHGYADGTFQPNKTTTRAMIVVTLYRLEGSPKMAYADTYSDVAADAWYTDAVMWATKNGIVNGFLDGSFGPDQTVTRQQLVAILYRYANFKGLDTSARGDLTVYGDADMVGSYAVEAMQWAVGSGVMNGTLEKELAPHAGTTRAQQAALLTRWCKNFAKK